MAERSFVQEVQKLRLGAGEEFVGEGILAVTKALLESGVSYVAGYQGAPISHLIADRAPKLSRGKLFFGLSFLILLVVSQVIWLFISFPLEEILNSSPAFNAIASKK